MVSAVFETLTAAAPMLTLPDTSVPSIVKKRRSALGIGLE